MLKYLTDKNHDFADDASWLVWLFEADDDFSFSLQGAPQLCSFFSRLNISLKTKRSEFFIKTGAAEFFIKFFAEQKSHQQDKKDFGQNCQTTHERKERGKAAVVNNAVFESFTEKEEDEKQS